MWVQLLGTMVDRGLCFDAEATEAIWDGQLSGHYKGEKQIKIEIEIETDSQKRGLQRKKQIWNENKFYTQITLAIEHQPMLQFP